MTRIRMAPFVTATVAISFGASRRLWRPDRFGRSLPHLLETVQELTEREITFLSLTEQIHTSTPSGEQVFSARSPNSTLRRNVLILQQALQFIPVSNDQ